MKKDRVHLRTLALTAIPEGHVPAYAAGRRYALCATEAIVGDTYTASDWLAVGSQFLGPLIDVDDPEELRDFIAGFARGIEQAATHRRPA